MKRIEFFCVPSGGPPTQTSTQYTYDPIGNIITKLQDGVPTDYGYEGNLGASYANPHAVTKTNAGGFEQFFSYDQMGNLVSDGASALINTWTYRNELETTTNAEVETTFRYNPSGRRVSLKEAEAFGDGGFAAMGMGAGPLGAGAGVALREIHYPTKEFSDYLHDATQRIHMEAAGITLATVERSVSGDALYHAHADHLGSTRNMTDAAGTVIESADYEPFGKLKNHVASTNFKEDRKFTSHELDEGTQYTYAKARYLNTEVGRFISQDPKFVYNPEQLLEDPQQMNSYAYARNNPIKFYDPDGKQVALAPSLGVAGQIGAGLLAIGAAIASAPAWVPAAIVGVVIVGGAALRSNDGYQKGFDRHRNEGIKQGGSLPEPDLGIPSPPTGPEDVIKPNLKPPTGWGKWALGCIVLCSHIGEIVDAFKKLSEWAKEFKEKSQQDPGNNQGGTNPQSSSSQNYGSQTYVTPNGVTVDWYGNVIIPAPPP